jgi:hypothetical protein
MLIVKSLTTSNEQADQSATRTANTVQLRWDDPSLWVGVSTGTCQGCNKSAQVLRHRVCFTCEQQLPKGFVQWANETRDAFYWTDGTNVFRSPISNAKDVATGYTLGRWESTVEHWNHYAKAFNRTRI